MDRGFALRLSAKLNQATPAITRAVEIASTTVIGSFSTTTASISVITGLSVAMVLLAWAEIRSRAALRKKVGRMVAPIASATP